MGDELADGDLLGHLVVEVLAVEHHGLQDGQGALQHRRVHGRLVHVAGDLQGGQGGRRSRSRQGAHQPQGAPEPQGAPAILKGPFTFLMKATEKVSQDTMPWSISSTKAVRVKDSRSPKLQDNTHTHTPQEYCLQQMAFTQYSCKAQMAADVMRTEAQREERKEQERRRGEM